MDRNLFQFINQLLTDTLSIDFHSYPEPYSEIETVDRGFRKWMSHEDSAATYRGFLNRFPMMRHHTFYMIQDEFLLNYILFLPYEDNREIFSLGPYRNMPYSQTYLKSVAKSCHFSEESMNSIKSFLFRVPEFIDNQRLISVARHILAYVNPNAKSFEIFENTAPAADFSVWDLSPTENFEIHIGEVQARYENEHNLINAISQGDTVEALLAAQNFNNYRYEISVDDYFQGRRAMLHTVNTFARLAAEKSDVHPVYLHAISSRYTQKIAEAANLVEVTQLREQMICDYCALVKEKARTGYSALIRDVINHIEFYLSSPLSLSTIAARFHVSAPYLSSLFKKETGKTITDYINWQRIMEARKLLLQTTTPIQEIASSVGIHDVNYFSKLFRRIVGQSPREFRKENAASALSSEESSANS